MFIVTKCWENMLAQLCYVILYLCIKNGEKKTLNGESLFKIGRSKACPFIPKS